MTKKQKEINQAWHLYAMPVAEIAKKHKTTQEDVCNNIVSWSKFYEELAG